jgi:hypothetical protein
MPASKPNETLFEDSFPFGPDALPEMYLEQLQESVPDGHDASRRYHLYATSKQMFLRKHGLLITPETFHQAVDVDEATPEDLIETAGAHYKRIRQMGIKVVGHMFGVIDPNSEKYISHAYYPTILTGAKLLLPDSETGTKKLGPNIGGTLNDTTIEKYKIADRLQKKLLEPIKAYYDWCQTTNQPYVLQQLNYLHSYVYFAPTQTIGLQAIETSMGSAELGNLDTRRRDFDNFAKITKALSD